MRFLQSSVPRLTPRSSLSCCRRRGKIGECVFSFAASMEVIIAVGGEDDKVVLRSVESFDPRNHSWKTLACLPFAVSKHGLVVTGLYAKKTATNSKTKGQTFSREARQTADGQNLLLSVSLQEIITYTWLAGSFRTDQRVGACGDTIRVLTAGKRWLQ